MVNPYKDNPGETSQASATARSSGLYEANLAALRSRYPDLAERIGTTPLAAEVTLVRAKDGGVTYAVRGPAGHRFLTNPINPIQHIQTQLDSEASSLQDSTRPVLVVGLYPGNELLFAFELAERITTPHCSQPIWVCIDSIPCLQGMLMAWDVRRIITSDRVRLFWHTEIPQNIAFLQDHPEFPHIFTMLSGAPDVTLNRLLPPFAQLAAERDTAALRMTAANAQYYDRMSDEQLASIIAGKGDRKPRLLMPTCSWSTFIQYSTRDTCAAFQDMGWETRILCTDAMLTPYCLVQAIHDFKPDVFLFIDHMRYEAETVYPHNMMFVSWIQDEMPNLQCKKAGEKLAEYATRGRRDLVVGYVEGLDTKHGYPKARLAPLSIPADPRIFRPVSLSASDKANHGCELAFMTNTSMPSDEVVETKIVPMVEPLGISRSTCIQIHDDLWHLYRSEQTITDRNEFVDWLKQYPEFQGFWNRHTSAATPETVAPPPHDQTQDDVFRLFYWRLNDTIYRHIVIEWADELGADMHLYGQGWERHPRFAKYARGPLAHGPELNIAYQAAAHCLHLNITQGMHQRIHEIMASGGHLLLRQSCELTHPAEEPPQELMQRLATAFRTGGEHTDARDLFREDIVRTQAEKDALSEWVFKIALSLAQQMGKTSTSIPDLEHNTLQQVRAVLTGRVDWNVEDWANHCFTNRHDFEKRLHA